MRIYERSLLHFAQQIRGERSLNADDLLPVLAWTVGRCRLVCAELEAELMAGLLPAALLAGEGGYYLTALFSAVAVLKKLAPEPAPDSTTPVSCFQKISECPDYYPKAGGRADGGPKGYGPLG